MRRFGGGLLLGGIALALVPGSAWAATVPVVPAVTVSVGSPSSPTQMATGLEILLALTVLSLAPAVLLLMTSFTRIVVVLGFARTALGSQQLPPTQVLVGLALFLTAFVMAPTISKVYASAWQPYQAGTLTLPQALAAARTPVEDFMLRQTRTSDLALFTSLQARQDGAPPRAGTGAASEPPLQVAVPAFVISELRTAFEMGFVLFIPFVIIDLVVASTLMAMGMVMLPPMLVSLPFKILLFVLVDGWSLLVQSLVLSFH